MDLELSPDKTTLGARSAIARRGACTIILATGASRFAMADALVADRDEPAATNVTNRRGTA